MLQQVFKLGKLRVIVIVDAFPFQPHLIQQFLILAEHIDIFRLEVIPLENSVLWIVFGLLVQFLLDFVIRQAIFIHLVDVHIGSDENPVVFPHANQVLVGLAEIVHRNLEGIEAAFQSLHQAVFANASQAAADEFRIVVQTVGHLRLQTSNGLIASVIQLLVQGLYCLLKQGSQVVVKFVLLFDRFGHLGKAVDVLAVASYTLDVCPGSSYGEWLDYLVAHTFCELLELHKVEVRLLAHLPELHHQRREECGQVRHTVDGAMTWVLEHQDLII